MEISGLIEMAAKAFINSDGSGDAGSNLDLGSVSSALLKLVSNNNGSLDIASIISGMQGGDMGNMLMSWMGSGDNDSISGSQIGNIFNSDKISEFSSSLGLSSDNAIGGLQDAIPAIVDNATNDGNLLDSIGGVQGAMNLASKFF